MSATTFNPVNSFRFDVNVGQITTTDSSGRLLLPAEAVAQLLAGLSDEAVMDFGHLIGNEVGRRVADGLGDPSQASTPDLLDHLGGNIALLGLGSVELERWGAALVVAVTGTPLAERGDPLLAGILEGALARCLSRQLSAVPLGRDGEVARFALLSNQGAERVRNALGSGQHFGQALAELQATG